MKLLYQPYSGKLGSCLQDDLASGKYHSLALSVAYARISGVDALYDSLTAFRAAGGLVHATVGIDQRNTSYEALRALLGLADELFLFHNRSAFSTFHPKAYLLAGEKWGKLYVGSNNLTGGGLYSNYEAIGCEEFDLTRPASAEEFAHTAHLLAGLRAEGPCCKPATEELIQNLYESRLLCSEREMHLACGKSTVGKSSFFGIEPIAGHEPTHDFRALSPAVPVRPEFLPTATGGEEGAADNGAAAEPEDESDRGFYKHLSRNDVDLKSSPGQIIIPIGFLPFFRPLSEQQLTRAGAKQAERYFNVRYENSGTVVENARVIFYVPSPQAPRKNSELRFALRNRQIFQDFQQGDVLVFSKAPQSQRDEYLFSVERIPGDSAEAKAYPRRFAWLDE